MKTYIQLTGAKTGHLYHISYYDVDGTFIDKDMIALKDLDKRCPRNVKLRLNGTTWGRLSSQGNILPVGTPKFLRIR